MITPSRLWDSSELIHGKCLEQCLVLVKPSITNHCLSLKLGIHTGLLMLPKTNYHTFSGLKQHRFILLQVSRVSRAAFLLEALGKRTCFLAFSSF